MTIGMMEITSAAMNRFQFDCVDPLNIYIFTVIVLSAESLIRMLGIRKSFQVQRKNSTTIVTVVGRTRGK